MLITSSLKVFNKMVPIEKISLHSHKKVKVKCDNCGSEKEIQYQAYNTQTNNNSENYYCNKKECINKKRKISVQKKYGVDNIFQIEQIKEKIKETNIEKYGVENPQQNIDIKNKTEETNLKKYGVRNPFQSEMIKEKIKETNIEKYGVEHSSQSDIIKAKKGETSLKNYGFIYPTQNREHLYKRFTNGLKVQKIDNLHYQGTYEKDFILRYKDDVKIEDGISIEYYYLNEKKVYHTDFYLPEYNLVIEIKSSYWYNIHKEQCDVKSEYVRKTHNYIMILDKNYTDFETIIKYLKIN